MEPPPPLLALLAHDGLLPAAAVEALARALPAEAYVRTPVRGGEAFDSTRWPIARDAALASLAAWRLRTPDLTAALVELARIGEDLEALQVRFTALFNAFTSGAGPSSQVLQLYHAHLSAAEGLYAYHVYRRAPGPSATSADVVVRAALRGGQLTADELLAAARVLVDRKATTRPFAELLLRLHAACVDVGRATGARLCGLIGDGCSIPRVSGALHFLLAAGPRLCVALGFDDGPPRWLAQVREHRSRALDLQQGAWTLVLDPALPEGARAPAAVAALARYADVMVAAHLERHPDDGSQLPVLDDAALGRLCDP